jgi:hypothetical protein
MRISDYRTTQCQRQAWMSADAYGLFTTAKGRAFLLVASLAIIAATAIFSHLYGRHLAIEAIRESESAIRQLELERQQLEIEKSGQVTRMQAMNTATDRLQAQLDAIVPSKNRYTINPNQSLLVADDHLTVGMIGVPGMDGIEINVNGEHHLAAVGDVIHATAGPSTACDVKIQSFDMFNAQITATCAEIKTH